MKSVQLIHVRDWITNNGQDHSLWKMIYKELTAEFSFLEWGSIIGILNDKNNANPEWLLSYKEERI